MSEAPQPTTQQNMPSTRAKRRDRPMTEDELKEYRKSYYAENKDRLKEYQNNYRQAKKEYYNHYRVEKKDELQAKYRSVCPHCNKEFNKYYLDKHINSKHNNTN